MTLKRLFVGVLVIAVSVAVAACGRSNTRMKDAEKLLSKKYGEEFVVTSYKGQEAMKDYYTVTAYAKSHPELPFEARGTEDGSSISDDYVSRRVCAAVSERVAGNLAALPAACYVHTGLMSGDSVCPDPDVTVEEFASRWEPYNRYYIYVYIPEKALHDGMDAGQLHSVLAGAVSDLPMLTGNLSVYISSDDMIAKVQKYVENNTGLYDDYFEMTDNGFCGQFDFENGAVSITPRDAAALLSQ